MITTATLITLLIFSTIFSLFYGVLSRMAGGGFINLPFGLDQWLYAIPYGLVAFLALLGSPLWVTISLTLLAYLGAFLGKRTGHGQWMDLGTWTGKVAPERLDFVVKWFLGEDKNTKTSGVKGDYWRDFTGLAVSGLAVSLIAGIIVASTYSIWLGLFLLMGGAMKSVSYSIGWFINGYDRKPLIKHEEFDEATELGEYLTGFFGGIPLFLTIFLLTRDLFLGYI